MTLDHVSAKCLGGFNIIILVNPPLDRNYYRHYVISWSDFTRIAHHPTLTTNRPMAEYPN